MELTSHSPAELERRLRERAREKGMGVSEYVEGLVARGLHAGAGQGAEMALTETLAPVHEYARPHPLIYVDFDDVLCETARGLTLLLERLFGKRVAYEEIHWFELDRSFGLTAEELKHFFEVGHRPENLARLEPVDGAREVLAEWQARGCEVCVVTGRPPETAEPSHAWLETHEIPYDRLIFVDKYQRLPPGPDLVTLDALAGMEFALAIDDAPAMLRFLVEATSVPVVVYDRPWNAGFTSSNGRAHRCRTWAEIAARAIRLIPFSVRSGAIHCARAQ